MSSIMTRRVAARSLMLAVVAGIAAACQGKTQDQLQADVELIVNGLKTVVPTLQGLPENLRPSADIMAQVQKALDTVQANASQVGTALAPHADAIQAVSDAVVALSGLLSPYFQAAPVVAAVVQAALALLPGLLVLVQKAPPAAAAKARAGMSPAEARKKLTEVAS